MAGVQRGEDPVVLPALPVTLVSTHGAGDVFVGALVTALAAGQSFAECLRSANAAAATHVSTRARGLVALMRAVWAYPNKHKGASDPEDDVRGDELDRPMKLVRGSSHHRFLI